VFISPVSQKEGRIAALSRPVGIARNDISVVLKQTPNRGSDNWVGGDGTFVIRNSLCPLWQNSSGSVGGNS